MEQRTGIEGVASGRKRSGRRTLECDLNSVSFTCQPTGWEALIAANNDVPTTHSADAQGS